MRMWNVPTQLMCRQHLLGEHLEMHMFASCVRGNKKLSGYITSGLVEIHNIQKRHDELVIEMKSRGYQHKTPLDFAGEPLGRVDGEHNVTVLYHRCKNCKERIDTYLKSHMNDVLNALLGDKDGMRKL